MTPSAENARRDLLAIYQAAVAAVGGRRAVGAWLRDHPLEPGPVYLMAVGKAATAMAHGALDVLGERIVDAWVVTKHGYAETLPWPVATAGHPLPDAHSLAAGERLLAFIDALPPGAQVLCLLSGGASALVEVLPPGMDLADLERLTHWLLGSGLPIAALNRIRKRHSLIKGGRLATHLAGRPVCCLAISDVRGDIPGDIGSGPLVADVPAGGPDQPPAEEILPPPFASLPSAPPAPPAADPCFETVRFVVVAGLDAAKREAAGRARSLGYQAAVSAVFVDGDAAEAGRRLAGEVLAAERETVLIWGGETTVTLPSQPGRGGRCQSLALAAATTLAGRPGHWLLAAGTDGTDGPGEDAGALVDDTTVARGQEAGLDAAAALAAADAGRFLAASGDLVNTGPTGTNVMDLMLGLKLG